MEITSSEQFLLHTTIRFKSHKTNKLITRIKASAHVKSIVKAENKPAYFVCVYVLSCAQIRRVKYDLLTLGTQLFINNNQINIAVIKKCVSFNEEYLSDILFYVSTKVSAACNNVTVWAQRSTF